MKLFTTVDSTWACQLLSKVFPGVEFELGGPDDSHFLLEDVAEQMKYIYKRSWKCAGLISFEPFHHFSGPYDFIMCGNTEQCIGNKLVPFYMFDYLSNFGKNIRGIVRGPLVIPEKFACAFVSNPMSTPRNSFMKMLLELNLLDSYGQLYNNTGGPYKPAVHGSPTLGTDIDDIVKQYKFYICFENSSHDAYISEKPLTALRNGVIPVYYGCKTARDYFNENRVIVLKNDTQEEMIRVIRYMISISRDTGLYNNMISAPLFKNDVCPNSFDSYASQIRRCLLN